MAKHKPVKVGIVGLGRIGWSHHARALAKKPHFELTACVDTLDERRAEAESEFGCQTFTDLKHLLKSGLCEMVIICTRSNDHCEHTVDALRAGMHVMVEKPMAMSVREADRMIAAAERAGRVLTVNQSRRYGDNVRYVRELLNSRLLGDVFWIRYSGQEFRRRNDWQQLKKFGGGYLNNNGAHSVDFAIQLLDSPVADVWGDLKHTVTAGDADDWLKVVLRGENGRVIEVEQSYACAIKQPRWLIAGTTGTMQSMDEKTALLRFFDAKKAPKIQVNEGVPMDRSYRTDDSLPWEEREEPMTPKGQEPDLHDNVFDAIRKDKKLLISAQSVREQIRVMDAIRKSSKWQA